VHDFTLPRSLTPFARLDASPSSQNPPRWPRVLAVLTVDPGASLIFVRVARGPVSRARPWALKRLFRRPAKIPTEAPGCIVRRPNARRSRPNQLEWFRRLAAVANRDCEWRKWAGKQALPLGAVSARSGLSCAADAFGASHRDHHAPLDVKFGGAANVQGQEPRQRWIDNKHGVSMLRLRCT
jgi:hypothetical protein